MNGDVWAYETWMLFSLMCITPTLLIFGLAGLFRWLEKRKNKSLKTILEEENNELS